MLVLMELIPINNSHIFFSFFILQILKWYIQEGVGFVSLEMKNSLPSSKYGFARKIIYARLTWALCSGIYFVWGKDFSKTAQSSNYQPDSVKVLSWFKCYLGNPVKEHCSILGNEELNLFSGCSFKIVFICIAWINVLCFCLGAHFMKWLLYHLLWVVIATQA